MTMSFRVKNQKLFCEEDDWTREKTFYSFFFFFFVFCVAARVGAGRGGVAVHGVNPRTPPRRARIAPR